MSVEQNKQVALDWIKAHLQGDDFSKPERTNWDEVLQYLDDDVEFWLIPGLVTAGTYGKEDYIRFTEIVRKHVVGPFDYTINHVMGEDDFVHITAKGHCPLKNGKVFASEYSFLFQMRNGKILRLEEFMNTHHYNEVWAGVDLTGGDS